MVETTDSAGIATFTLPKSAAVGTSNFKACAINTDNIEYCTFGKVTAIACNTPPVCTKAVPSKDLLWPPNHDFEDITVSGVTDIDRDTITINIDAIYSDELTATAKGAGGITHAPDASGVGTNTAHVRAERLGLATGRVYQIRFTASDGHGGTCNGTVKVGVPHNKKDKPIDDGPFYDATL